MSPINKSAAFLACISAGAIALALALPAHAQTRDTPVRTLAPATPSCDAPDKFARFQHPLRHAAQRLAGDQPLTIVAIGSSSTAGAGASSREASYPSRLAVELRQMFPGHGITVINRGVNGEDTAQMLARFDGDVIAAHPDLVLWQVGTNSVLRDVPLTPHSVLLHEGITQLKEAGADVVLIDMQYAPRVLEKSETQDMENQIAFIAKQENVELFGRFALMRDWHNVQKIPFETFVAPDKLHMNDWGYACVAKLLARAIGEAATRPVAAAHSVH